MANKGEPIWYNYKADDALVKIAKTRKYKSERVIWDHKFNKQVAGKRKKPENLLKGDRLYLPATPAYIKVVDKAILNLNIMRDEMLWQIKVLTQLKADQQKNIKDFKAYMKKSEKDTAAYINALDRERRKVKKLSTTVETVQKVVGMARGLHKLGKQAYDSTKLVGDELKAANKALESEMMRSLAKNQPIAEQIIKATKGTKLEPLYILHQSTEKVLSWNHWFITTAALLEGHSWSEAVTYDFDEAFEKHSQYVVFNMTKMLARWHKEIARQEDLIKHYDAGVKEFKHQISNNETIAQTYMDMIA